MKLTIRCYTLLLLFSFATIKSEAQLAYSMHTLEKGETLSMLAKNYHTTVGDIMRMNGMNAQSQLHTGDKIKIPAGGTVVAEKPDVTASTPVVTSTASIPKTHVVATGETLYHISQMYKVPIDKLITLNNLPDGNVKVGQTLVLSGDAVSSLPPASQPAKARTEQTSTAIQTSSAPPVVKETKQQPPANENTSATNTPPQRETAPQTPVSKPAATAPVLDNSSSQPADTYPSTSNAPKEGFFTSMYGKDAQQKNEQTKNGSAMTFKSASGWADKKYYILMNDAPTGSIVKIKNGKSELYAKVLWNLGEMKENDGLSFRISTAAAAALGITDQKFDLKVSYYE